MSLQYATVQNPSLINNDVLNVAPLKRFYENMPAWMPVSLEKGKGLTDPLEKKKALTDGKLIQFNAAKLVRYLVFDVDEMHTDDITQADYEANTHYEHNCFYNWHAANLPPPHIIIKNTKNGHCQYFYELKTPVSTSDKSNQKIVFWLHSIRRAMTLELNADSAYTHHISRNPFNPTDQEVFYNLVEPYSLDQLTKNLDLSTTYSNQKPDDYLGLGRNNDTFHTVRFDAYTYKQKCKNYEQLYSFVLSRCHAVNAELFANDLLPHNEVQTIAKSIAEWVWEKYTGKSKHISKRLSKEKAKIGRKGGKVTGAAQKKNNVRKRKKALALVSEGVTKTEAARQVKVDRTTVNRWCKEVEEKRLLALSQNSTFFDTLFDQETLQP